MSTAESSPDDPFKVQHIEALQGGVAESRLKRHLGRSIYVQNVEKLADGNVEITLGNASPRNLSDCRDQDNVLKFITIRDVYSIHAEATGGGYYILDLPDRSAVVEGIGEREREILDKLDFSLAQAIYSKVYDLPKVRTQLNPILQILRWTRNQSDLTIGRVEQNQRSHNNREYIDLLESFGYIERSDRRIKPGVRLQSADLNEYDWDEFGRAFLGDIVQRGYMTIRDDLKISMLGHYQKYSGAYYYDAIQRGDKSLWLDIETIADNLKEMHDEDRGSYYLHDKLGELDSVGVIEKDGEFVRSDTDVFDTVAKNTPTG